MYAHLCLCCVTKKQSRRAICAKICTLCVCVCPYFCIYSYSHSVCLSQLVCVWVRACVFSKQSAPLPRVSLTQYTHASVSIQMLGAHVSATNSVNASFSVHYLSCLPGSRYAQHPKGASKRILDDECCVLCLILVQFSFL